MSRIAAQLGCALFLLVFAACGDGGPTSPGSTAGVQGTWSGTWTLAQCTETGGAIGVACARTPQSGGLRLTLTQAGNEVQGTVEVVQFVIPASGTVRTGSGLTLSGQSRAVVDGVGSTGTLSDWSTTRNGNTMVGSFTLTIAPDNGLLGTQIVRLSLQNVTLTS